MIARFPKSMSMRCFFVALGIVGLGWLSGRLAAEEAAAPSAKRVLLLTGEDYPGHKWQETTPVLRAQLAQDARLDIHVVEDLKFLRSPQLHDFAAIVIHFKNYDPAVPGPEGQANLARFVHQGGGAVLVHFACGAFQEWPEFVKLAGRVWDPKLRGHDPHGTFRVDIVDPQHPITQGLASFEVTDELYTCLAGDTPISLLATSVSKVDQKAYPIAFVLSYGQGRVFHCPLGHDVRAFNTPGVGELFRRGTAWAAGLSPTADR
jgi:uncharacterized protein